MTDIRDFAARMALDADAAGRALGNDPASQGDTQPWYVRGLLGVGAWMTSLPILALGAVLVMEIVPDQDGGLAFLVAGLGLFATGLALVRAGAGVFRTQLGVAFGAAGAVLSGAAMLVDIDALALATLITAGLAGIGIALTRDASFQAVLSMCAAGFGVASLLDGDAVVPQTSLALALPIGCFLLTHPPRRDLRSLAVVLLFTALFGLAWTDGGVLPDDHDATEMPGWLVLARSADPWLARAIAIATSAWLVLPAGQRGRHGPLLLPVAAALLCLVLPPSGGVGLAMIALAYGLGSRLLALGGGLGLCYALFVFYYDLDTTLLIKSAMLVAAGTIVLAVWRIVTPRGGHTP